MVKYQKFLRAADSRGSGRDWRMKNVHDPSADSWVTFHPTTRKPRMSGAPGLGDVGWNWVYIAARGGEAIAEIARHRGNREKAEPHHGLTRMTLICGSAKIR